MSKDTLTFETVITSRGPDGKPTSSRDILYSREPVRGYIGFSYEWKSPSGETGERKIYCLTARHIDLLLCHWSHSGWTYSNARMT